MAELPAITDRLPRAPWVGAALAACGCAVVAVVDPTEHMVTPPCPLRSLTGWWCPLCGGTRAASRLLHGDVATAFRFNAAFVTLLPLGILLWVVAAFPDRFAFLDPVRSRSSRIIVGVATVFLVFAVVRNTPWGLDTLRYPGA